MAQVYNSGQPKMADASAYPNVATWALTLVGNNNTTRNLLWTVTGIVEIGVLFGVVTTQFSSNVTASWFSLYDATSDNAITSNTGVAMSSFNVNSRITMNVSAVSSLADAQNGTTNPVAVDFGAGIGFPGRCQVQKKTGATTRLAWLYTTTNTPSSGAITFYAHWRPVSKDGNLA